MTGPVTFRPKRYVFVCAGCDRLAADSARKDQITWSPRCRVAWHRDVDRRRRLTQDARRWDITVPLILQGAAVDRLRPDLADAVIAGRLKVADTRGDVWAAYRARVVAAVALLKPTSGVCEARLSSLALMRLAYAACSSPRLRYAGRSSPRLWPHNEDGAGRVARMTLASGHQITIRASAPRVMHGRRRPKTADSGTGGEGKKSER